MTRPKLVALICYAILGVLALGVAGPTAATVSLGLIGFLVLAHLIEVAVFFKVCSQAEGSTGGHVLNVFLFGVLHVNQIKAASTAA